MRVVHDDNDDGLTCPPRPPLALSLVTGDWLAYLSTIVSTFAQPSNHSRDDDVPLLLLWLLRLGSFYDTLHLILLGLSCVFCRRRLPISQKRIQLFAMAKEDDEEEEDDIQQQYNELQQGSYSYQEKDQLSGICISVPLSCWMYVVMGFCIPDWAGWTRRELWMAVSLYCCLWLWWPRPGCMDGVCNIIIILCPVNSPSSNRRT